MDLRKLKWFSFQRSLPLPALCRLGPDRGPCGSRVPRWYHDPGSKDCQRFSWSGCGGNDNNFLSIKWVKSRTWPVSWFHFALFTQEWDSDENYSRCLKMNVNQWCHRHTMLRKLWRTWFSSFVDHRYRHRWWPNPEKKTFFTEVPKRGWKFLEKDPQKQFPSDQCIRTEFWTIFLNLG